VIPKNVSRIIGRLSAAGLCFLFVALAVSGPAAPAERPPVAKANYELAARFTAARVGKLVSDTSVRPHWLASGDRFWYSYETSRGKMFWMVDPARRSKTPIFDNARLAAMLTRISLFPYDAQHLPIKTLRFVKRDTAVVFELEVPKGALLAPPGKPVRTVDEILGEQQRGQKQQEQEQEKETDKDKSQEKDKEKESKTKTLFFEYDLAKGTLDLLVDYQAPAKKPKWASLSPDEKTVVFARGHNLFLMDAESYALAQKKADDPKIKEVQITQDGEEHYSYARRLHGDERKDFEKEEKDRKDPRVPAVTIFWSRDSRRFALVRDDERKVADLWVINSLAEPRPTLETYRYEMPGEENIPQPEILIFDRETRTSVKVKSDQFKDQSLSIAAARLSRRGLADDDRPSPQWLSDSPDKLYFIRQSRDRHKLDVCLADAATGEARPLIEERLNTYIETRPLRLVGNGREIIHWSERDGWGHYYLCDGNGGLKNQITSGEFNCRSIEGIDEKNRVLYFTACGREPGQNPYFVHLYRINLDGTGLRLLDPEEASHDIDASDSSAFFVDTFSRVDTAPRSVLRDSLGTAVLDLDETDLARLFEAGYKFPEPFEVKADDGITDLYGVMYKPFDFDPGLKYPIIAYVYPGPQTESVTTIFSPKSQNVALAQLGFIVIEVGNRGGSPQRSKWYHNYGYGNLRDYGLADKKAAIQQLAARFPFIDLERVGIYGHSGGGFMSTAAMLVYPDFFKVAVSSSGNHENDIYNRWWSETHHGVKEVVDKDGKVRFEYSIAKNSELARNLKGHLLLTTGDMDDNVHMANTLRLAAALIKANKRFDFFILPGQRHGYGDMNDYFFWLRADYFCRYLLGDTSRGVDVEELNVEKGQAGDKKAGK
jgi:dipeptidyl-peptidase-4